MEKPLFDKTVALLVASGFEEYHMTEPQRALLAVGAQLKLVSPEQGLVNGWLGKAWGHYFPVDVALSTALAADYDVLVVPGGSRSINKLADLPHAQRFVRGFTDGGKPIVMIGDAVSLLTRTERVKDRVVAADGELGEAMSAAGAKVSDEPLTVDGWLLTARDDVVMGSLQDAVVKHVIDITMAMDAAA